MRVVRLMGCLCEMLRLVILGLFFSMHESGLEGLPKIGG
jgi:hypothetical protein